MPVSVVEASRHDVPHLVASAAALFAEDGGRRDPLMDTGWPRRDGAGYYRSLVTDENSLCLLAWSADDVVGHLIGRMKQPDPLRPGAVTAALESMRVHQDHRRDGVGSALFSAFLGWSTNNRATELNVTAYATNDTALAFYRSHGFDPFMIRLHRRLS